MTVNQNNAYRATNGGMAFNSILIQKNANGEVKSQIHISGAGPPKNLKDQEKRENDLIADNAAMSVDGDISYSSIEMDEALVSQGQQDNTKMPELIKHKSTLKAQGVV